MSIFVYTYTYIYIYIYIHIYVYIYIYQPRSCVLLCLSCLFDSYVLVVIVCFMCSMFCRLRVKGWFSAAAEPASSMGN